MMEEITIEEIIIKECKNQQLNPSERMKLDVWLEESPKNRKVYTQMKLAMLYPNAARRQGIQQEVWNNLMGRFSTTKKAASYRFPLTVGKNWLKIAAVMLLCLSVAIIAYQLKFKDLVGHRDLLATKKVEKVSLPGQKITTLLSDGTVVKLNADSKLVVPEYFTGENREVELIGEAFFDVARDESKPFIIKTNDIEIRVLGTSFNVSAYEDGTSKTVSVKSGKVAVKNNNKRMSVVLEPNEMTVLNREGNLEKQPIENPSIAFGWTEQRIVFKDQPIEKVLHTISKWYGVEVQFENKIESEKLYTAHYENPGLREVMESISHVYNFNYSIDEKKVIIK